MPTTKARILSPDVLREVRAALAEFSDTVSNAFISVDVDIQRVTHWLNSERPAHWKHEIRKREDQVAKCEAEIRRKILIAAPEPASTVMEHKLLSKAKLHLDAARRKLEATKKWAPIWEREAMMYKSGARPLTEALRRDVPLAMRRLDRMLTSLEAYLKLAAPDASGIAPPAPSLEEAGWDPGESHDSTAVEPVDAAPTSTASPEVSP